MDCAPEARADDIVRLLVCATCRAAGAPDDAPRPGAVLGAALDAAVATPAHAGIVVEMVECLSVCKRPCTVAISGTGRWTYIYGDIDPDAGAALLIDFAHQYRAAPDGIVPWRQRPEAIRKGVVARIPPLPSPRSDKANP